MRSIASSSALRRLLAASALSLAVGCDAQEYSDLTDFDTGDALRATLDESGGLLDGARSTTLTLSCPSRPVPVTYDGELSEEQTFVQDDFWIGEGSCGTFTSSAEAQAALEVAKERALRACKADAPRFECDEGCDDFTRKGTCEVTVEEMFLIEEIPPVDGGTYACVLGFEVVAEATDQGACLQASGGPEPVDH